MSFPIAPTTTAGIFTAPIPYFHTCPDGSPCGYYPDGQPATAASTHALNNTTRVLRLSLLAFIALRLFVRRASIGALIGLCLIAGGFPYDVGFGLPGVDAATAKWTTDSIASSTKPRHPRICGRVCRHVACSMVNVCRFGNSHSGSNHRTS